MAVAFRLNKMKNVFLIFAVLVAVATSGFAQVNQRITMLQPTGAASDTVTNTGTITLSKAFKGGAKAIGFQVAVTKTSGTVAGNIILQGSLDGTNYHDIDTLAATNTTGTKYYKFALKGEDAYYTDYRISWTGSGTMVAIASAIFVAKE